MVPIQHFEQLCAKNERLFDLRLLQKSAQLQSENAIALKMHKESAESKIRTDAITKTNSCETCSNAVEICQDDQVAVKPLNTKLLTNCGKVVDDCSSLFSSYLKLAKEMELEGTSASDELDFSGPAAIKAFCMKTFS